MSRSREPDRYNEHGQDDRVSLEERLWDRDMTPGMDEWHGAEQAGGGCTRGPSGSPGERHNGVASLGPSAEHREAA